jgi:uncharacterized protein (DUF2164 family)
VRIGILEANEHLGFILEELGPSIYNKDVAPRKECSLRASTTLTMKPSVPISIETLSTKV